MAPGRPASEQIVEARLLLRDADREARIVGALPFDLDEPGSLWIGVPSPLVVEDDPAPFGEETRIPAVAEDPLFEQTVREALLAIGRGELRKVVPARHMDIVVDEPVDVPAVVARLAQDPQAVGFSVLSDEGHVVGASPEILVRRDADTVISAPLAGSRPRSEYSHSDVEREFLESAKDLEEHALVVDDIVAQLSGIARDGVETVGPSVTSTRRLWHLASEISARIDPGMVDSLAVVERLQPTAAVCGSPRDMARAFLRAQEPFSRGLYAGAVGWQDHAGDGEWRVTLRCGLVDGRRVRLFAGAGVVAGSVSERELAETTVKMGTFLDALAGPA